MKNFKKNEGLTLIELLIVITIVAILSTIGLATFINARKRAEDSAMIANVRAAQTALEQTYDMVTNEYSESEAKDSFEGEDWPEGISVDVPGSTYCVVSDDLNNLDGGNCGGTCDTIGGATTHFCAKELQGYE